MRSGRFGEIAFALFPSIVDPSTVNDAPDSATTPPPFDCAPPATFSLTVVSTSVIVPQLSIPAASPNDGGHGPSGHAAFTLGTEPASAARLPVPPIAVTPASPGPQVGTSGPHAGACGLPVATPSRIVTPAIDTVGADAGDPIVTTGPPPRMTVAAAPAPTSVMLFVIVRPPAKTPGPTRTTSPLDAAATPA